MLLNKRPKISIITPSYNQGKFIEETILSVINQGYENIEYIIIDGGSSDETVDIIKKYDSKIDYWISESDKGQTHAINKGFAIASGDIITWINSDDIMEVGALKNVADEFINDKNLICLFGQFIEFDENGHRPFHRISDESLSEWLYKTPFAQPSTYYKRTILDEIGYLDESLQFSMDNDFFKRIILFGYKYKYTDKVLSKFRWHDTSKSNNLHELCRENDALIYQTILESLPNPITLDILSFGKDAGIFIDNKKRYIIKVPITDYDIINSFTQFITFYIGRWYNTGNFKMVTKAFKFINKDLGTINQVKNTHLKTIYYRNKYIPNKLIEIFRKLK